MANVVWEHRIIDCGMNLWVAAPSERLRDEEVHDHVNLVGATLENPFATESPHDFIALLHDVDKAKSISHQIVRHLQLNFCLLAVVSHLGQSSEVI